MSPSTAKAALEDHAADWHEDTRTVVCSCGDATGYLAHITALLRTDELGARLALLEAHEFTEINAGMCGGCDTCGSDSASAVCAICGEGYSPCGAYFEAILNPDGTHYEFPTTEGLQ
jgi:hypothetical protein